MKVMGFEHIFKKARGNLEQFLILAKISSIFYILSFFLSIFFFFLNMFLLDCVRDNARESGFNSHPVYSDFFLGFISYLKNILSHCNSS